MIVDEELHNMAVENRLTLIRNGITYCVIKLGEMPCKVEMFDVLCELQAEHEHLLDEHVLGGTNE